MSFYLYRMAHQLRSRLVENKMIDSDNNENDSQSIPFLFYKTLEYNFHFYIIFYHFSISYFIKYIKLVSIYIIMSFFIIVLIIAICALLYILCYKKQYVSYFTSLLPFSSSSSTTTKHTPLQNETHIN